MVDINLFREDDEEKEKGQWEPSSSSEDSLGSDLGDELMFEDEGKASAPLHEDLLKGEEAIPDFDTPDDRSHEEDFEYGEVKGKKTSIGVWIALFMVMVAAGVYLFVLQPKEAKRTKGPSQVRRPGQSQVGEQVKQPGSTKDTTSTSPSTTAKPVTRQLTGMMDRGIPGSVIPAATFVDATKALLEDLTKQRQFGAVLITGDRFFVEYVSETPNVASSMGHRIQTVIGASGFKTSPEERHQTAGQIRYWGVVSGNMPTKVADASATNRVFDSESQFTSALREKMSQHQMRPTGTQKLSESREGGSKQLLMRIRTEGSKANALAFLEGLKSFQGNNRMLKLLLVPVNYSDFAATQVKIVIDYALVI